MPINSKIFQNIPKNSKKKIEMSLLSQKWDNQNQDWDKDINWVKKSEKSDPLKKLTSTRIRTSDL